MREEGRSNSPVDIVIAPRGEWGPCGNHVIFNNAPCRACDPPCNYLSGGSSTYPNIPNPMLTIIIIIINVQKQSLRASGSSIRPIGIVIMMMIMTTVVTCWENCVQWGKIVRASRLQPSLLLIISIIAIIVVVMTIIMVIAMAMVMMMTMAMVMMTTMPRMMMGMRMQDLNCDPLGWSAKDSDAAPVLVINNHQYCHPWHHL